MEKPMSILEAINKRASTRSFIRKEIDGKTIEALLTSATFAPSSGNMQPWEFIVVKEQSLKDQLVECTFLGYFSKGSDFQTWIGEAGVIFIVCANVKRTVARYGEPGKEWAAIDVAAATENLLLTATGLGLAGCWVGGFNEEKLKSILKIPSYVKPIGMIPVGYPKGVTERKYRMPLKWITHDGQYNVPYFKDGEDDLDDQYSETIGGNDHTGS
jgi:nitroreductase